MMRLPDKDGSGSSRSWWGRLGDHTPSYSHVRLGVIGCGVYALVGGLVTLAGWMTGIQRLIDWEGNGITMKANPAIASALLGASVLLLVRRPRHVFWIRGLSIPAMALGGLTLVEHLTTWDLRIDTLLFDEAPGARATAAPGRMGVPASTSFLLLGAATCLLTCGRHAREWPLYLGMVAATIASLSLTGHLYGADLMFSIPRLTGIACQTASFILALALAVVGCLPERDPVKMALDRGSGGLLIRRLVPVLIVVPLALGWMNVWIQEKGLADAAFGTALGTVVEVALLIIILWSAARSARRHERALFENRELLKTTLQSIGDGVITTDSNGRVTYLNSVAEVLTGWTKLEARGESLQEVFRIVGEATRKPLPNPASRALDLRTPEQIPEHPLLVSRRGREIPVADTAAPILDAEGKVAGCVLVFRDASSQRNAERDLRSHAEELERRVQERTAELQSSNEQLEAFVYSIAHDLRAPLRTMASFSQLLVEDHSQALDATGKDFLRRIKEGSEFMDRLLLDLLDYGFTSQAEMKLDSVAVQNALDSACKQLAGQISETGACIEVKGGPLPLIRGHEAILSQCLANLLSNSMKFVEPGVIPRIVISVEVVAPDPPLRAAGSPPCQTFRIWLCDNGIGIAPQHQERVFRVFERLYGGRYPGTGIGLSIVRKGIERMGGRVGINSKIGEGCQFWMDLPTANDRTK